MKLGPIIKLEGKNTATSKKVDDDVCRQIVTSLSFFQKQQPGSQIPDTLSITFTFSITRTFRLTKTEKRTKEYLTQLSYYCFE